MPPGARHMVFMPGALNDVAVRTYVLVALHVVLVANGTRHTEQRARPVDSPYTGHAGPRSWLVRSKKTHWSSSGLQMSGA
jgi:hypothetical protein